MKIVILKLLLRKLILSLCVLAALLIVNPERPWLYPIFGVVAAIALIPFLYPKHRARGQRPSQYWPVFLLNVMLWPDSILTQTLRAKA